MPEQQASKRVRRSKDDIVDAALGILDDQGLPDLTMRHLAEVLGVQPSALYWHFDSKQALLAAVSRRILAPLAGADTAAATLPEAATALGSRLRDCLLAYRDGAETVSSSLALGLIDAPLRAALADVARRSGVAVAVAETAAEAVTHLVVGYAFHEQQRMHAEALGVLGVRDTLTPEGAVTPADPDGEGFAAVLALLATGLAATLAPAASGHRVS